MFRALAFAVVLATWAGAATAGSLVGLTADDTRLRAPAGTRILVEVAGKACGMKIDLGTRVVGPRVLGDGTHEFQAFFPKAGTYAVRVWGKKKGTKKACGGSPAPITIAVDERAFSAKPDEKRVIGESDSRPYAAPETETKGFSPATPIGEKVRARQPSDLRPVAPRATETGGLGRMDPSIHAVRFEPGPIGHIGGNIMAPGGSVIVEGVGFGEAIGRVFLKVDASKFPAGTTKKVSLDGYQPNLDVIELQNLLWVSGGEVRGRIPTGFTGPLYRTGANTIVVRADGTASKPFGGHFEVPAERRILRASDPEVLLLQCSEAAASGDCPEEWKQTEGATISGRHWGEYVQHRRGKDRWLIELDDGWTFRRIDRVYKQADDDDEYIRDPVPLPVGGTRWDPVIRWSVSPYDNVHYGWWVEVQRAKGAH